MSVKISIVGEGKPVVFLHGFLESSSMWNYLDFTSSPIQCITIDIPGHGDSTLPKSGTKSISNLAEIILDSLEKIGIKNFDLVGHSMGGYVALEIAKKVTFDPKVILLNSNFWDDTEEKKNNRNRVISIIRQNKDLFIHEAIPGLFCRPDREIKAIEQLITEAKSISIEGIEYATIAMRDREDLTNLAHKISSRLVCLQGEKDAIVTKKDMIERCQDKIPYIILPSVGHMAHIESSKIVQETIEQILFEKL